jgi:protein MpaA
LIAACLVVLATTGAADDRSSNVRREVIGTSIQGREIEAIRIGRGIPVLIVGVIHGREEAGLAITDLLERMAPPSGVEWWIVPNMNPDGVAMNLRGNANRVDLNRNFPYQWAPLGRKGYWQYSGPSRASEPETKAMVEFVRRIKPVFGIWYHQDLNVISPSTGLEGRLRRTYASLTGLPMKRITGGTYTGVAGTWQRRAHPRGMTMIVELGPTLDATQAQTHADAVVTVSELLHSQWK